MNPAGWIPGAAESAFDISHLPYGVFSVGDESPRVGVAIGEYVLDVAPLATSERVEFADTFNAPTLNPFMALGPSVWQAVRGWLTAQLTDESYRDLVGPALVPLDSARLHPPFTVADYVDFYASEHHAANLGRILRPGEPPLLPNWKHLPIGYHGRSGTVALSGTPVIRPCGQVKPGPDADPTFEPTRRLDIEAEVGFVVGTGTTLGTSIDVDAFADHVFGVVLVNDWSARDIQAWEYRPLGPFLGKSFLTSISPWVTPLAALDAARIACPPQDPEPLPYLHGSTSGGTSVNVGLDLELEVRLNGCVVSRPTYRDMYWTPAQMLAHLTCGGASARTGDLFASGTVSGPEPGTWGSLMELSAGGTEPITLADGSTRTFLRDGDEVVIGATAPGPAGSRIRLGDVSGTVTAAPRG